MEVFVSDPPDSAEDDGEGNDLPPPSMRRTLAPLAQPDANETNVFRKSLQQSSRISERYIAGILLLDVASYSWKRHAFEAE